MNSPLQSAANFSPRLDSIRPESISYFKAVCNPTSNAKKLGIYQPRITYTQRHVGGHRMKYELAIELSLPKLLYDNNFDELADNDFPTVVSKLIETLRGMNIWLFTKQIEEAEVRAIHYSKNIVFTDYTSCSSILAYLSQADVSKTYDVQKTDFRNGGHIFHIHTNSIDIALYDKVADLKQSKVSEKRSTERDNYIQMNLLDMLEETKPLSVLRFEIRLGKKRLIKNRLEDIGVTNELTFSRLFSQEIAQKVLQQHWKHFFGQISLVSLDADSPDKLLANILKSDNLRPRQALAQLGYTILRDTTDARYVRTLLEDRFGKHVWPQVKKLAVDIPKTQYKALLAIDDALAKFEPTKLTKEYT